MLANDTIAAISTPLGEGGIGIVKISGSEAYAIATKIFNYSSKADENLPVPRKLYHGHIKNDAGDIIDEVLLSYMPAPHTYTREDIVEINCHSGIFALRSILKLVLKAGARLASPGEFTKRAFASGRIDLTQAESVINIIRARSEEAVITASRVMSGELAGRIQDIKGQIIELRAPIEAMLDYPDEFDDLIPDRLSIANELKEQLRVTNNLLKGIETSRAYQEGVSATIIGRPNVGKSSLLNALLRQQKAIVHETPGTTRDLLEGYMNLGGYPLRLIDTAGIQGTEDPIEKIGIERTQQAAREAKLLIIVLDGSKQINEEDWKIINQCKASQGLVVVINKRDLEQLTENTYIKKNVPNAEVVNTSAISGKGIEDLEAAVARTIDRMVGDKQESSLIISMRHEEILTLVKENMIKTIENLEFMPWDILSGELQNIWSSLGEITGETINDDLLDKVFSQFCLGK